jgi:hypothetical protein
LFIKKKIDTGKLAARPPTANGSTPNFIVGISSRGDVIKFLQ